MEEIIVEDALNSDLDDSDWEDESGEVVGNATAKRKFDSQLEMLLWFITAGRKNTSLPKRSRETWLQPMRDDRYRLQKVLDAWDSASGMEKCLRKAAIGEVRRASTMQAFRLTSGFSLVGTFEFFWKPSARAFGRTPCKRFDWRLVSIWTAVVNISEIKRNGLRLTITLNRMCTLCDDAIARTTKDYLQGARLINLQRHGKDPDVLWLSYIPELDLVRKMCSNIRNKEGFVLKPRVKVQEVRRTAKWGVETIREYDHPPGWQLSF
jgi:hypothetical protein